MNNRCRFQNLAQSTLSMILTLGLWSGLLMVSVIGVGFLQSEVWAQGHVMRIKSTKTNVWAYIAPMFAERFPKPSTTPAANKVLSRYTPVRVIATENGFSRIRDVWGNDGFVRSNDLKTSGRYVVARDPVNTVFSAKNINSRIVYEVTRDVALKALSFDGKWYKVRHYSGATGYMPSNTVLAP